MNSNLIGTSAGNPHETCLIAADDTRSDDILFGARGGTRTRTPSRAQEPKSCASASSATRAATITGYLPRCLIALAMIKQLMINDTPGMPVPKIISVVKNSHSFCDIASITVVLPSSSNFS